MNFQRCLYCGKRFLEYPDNYREKFLSQGVTYLQLELCSFCQKKSFITEDMLINKTKCHTEDCNNYYSRPRNIRGISLCEECIQKKYFSTKIGCVICYNPAFIQVKLYHKENKSTSEGYYCEEHIPSGDILKEKKL